MTFVHPNGAARPARIRILGTTPPPPPPRRGPNRGLLAACVAVAAFGVGITLLVRPQISDDPSPQAAPATSIDLMGLVNLGARMPDARALRVLTIASPDFDSAARIEAQRQRVTPVPAGITTAPTVSSPSTSAVASNPPVATQPRSAPATAGPDQPPNPASPNTFLDQP